MYRERAISIVISLCEQSEIGGKCAYAQHIHSQRSELKGEESFIQRKSFAIRSILRNAINDNICTIIVPFVIHLRKSLRHNIEFKTLNKRTTDRAQAMLSFIFLSFFFLVRNQVSFIVLARLNVHAASIRLAQYYTTTNANLPIK